MGNDRQKMAFFVDMLFDSDLNNDTIHELPPDNLRVDVVYEEVRNWLRRNPMKSPLAEKILAKHAEEVPLGHTAGPLPPNPLATVTQMIDELDLEQKALQAQPPSEQRDRPTPQWNDATVPKEEQDRLYGRVSHEIDVWWKRVRDPNYESWVQTMETVESAMARAQVCKDNAMTRFMPQSEPEHEQDYEPEGYDDEHLEEDGPPEHDGRSLHDDDREEEEVDEEEEEDEEDDDSYVEGPLRGLLTEVPNILDTKQIEALHMTIKACIVDSMGSGLTKAGENLQKTRCKMLLAMDCGKNILREMLVFIAVWEQLEDQFIFQITAQIIESFHHNALLPYAWNSLRILKDIVSPAQTVLLRLINYMFRARKDTTIYQDVKDFNRDAKLIFFLYNYFRTRVVPDCIGLIYAQAQIRSGHAPPSEFPVDLWDMERAKDGLYQYMDFIAVVADIPEMKPFLIKWEVVYELVALLNALDAGVERKRFDDRIPLPPHPTNAARTSPIVERPYDPSAPTDPIPTSAPTPGLPPLHDTPHKFPWSGIKNQILTILCALLNPPAGQPRPGNPDVQKQILKYEGLMPLFNCCAYDGHNEYLKERATVAMKFIMDGCPEAQAVLAELQPLKDQRGAAAVNGSVGNVVRERVEAARRAVEQQQGRVEEITEVIEERVTN
jgi:palmitoyltransferase